jgi:hypothetical protein
MARKSKAELEREAAERKQTEEFYKTKKELEDLKEEVRKYLDSDKRVVVLKYNTPRKHWGVSK